MANQLQKLLAQLGASQSLLATQCGRLGQPVSAATINQIAKHDHWPKSWDRTELQAVMQLALQKLGASLPQANGVFANKPAVCSHTRRGTTPATAGTPTTEDVTMLLRKQSFTPKARSHFKFTKLPFAEPQEVSEVFFTPDSRYVRDVIWQATKHADFLAVVGESGAGKSTLRRELLDRIRREAAPVVVIEPYVLAMEDSDTKGKVLKSAAIADAIIRTLAPSEAPKRSQDGKFNQIHRLLKSGFESGYRHVLLIEEAHSLPTATLKHLKRFYELELGFKKLLSIVLIGQTELRNRLDERLAEVREVTQRCQIISLDPLNDRLGDYLEHQFKRVNASSSQLLEAGALDAITAKLTQPLHGKQRLSLLYPLAVNNLLIAAFNEAADLGETQITADVINSL